MSENDSDTHARKNFIRVSLKSDGLPTESVRRIDKALQRALLIELAEMDIAPTARIQLAKASSDKPGGSTEGIYVELPADDSPWSF